MNTQVHRNILQFLKVNNYFKIKILKNVHGGLRFSIALVDLGMVTVVVVGQRGHGWFCHLR